MVSAYIASTSGIAGGNKPRINDDINEFYGFQLEWDNGNTSKYEKWVENNIVIP